MLIKQFIQLTSDFRHFSAKSLIVPRFITQKLLFLAEHRIMIRLDIIRKELSCHSAVVMKITECDQTKTQIEKRENCENRGCEAFLAEQIWVT